MIVVEPTVIAPVAEAGDELHASPASLPAATTTVTPSWTARFTARFSRLENLPPSEIDATLADAGCDATQSSARMVSELKPEPAQLSTRSAWSVARGATPSVAPAAMPAVCEPCPSH